MSEETLEGIVADHSFGQAQIGDLLMDRDDRPIPDGWHEVDGSTLISYEWPDFVAAMRIRGAQFTLPFQERKIEGQRPLIKLGSRRPLPQRPEPTQVQAPVQGSKTPAQILLEAAQKNG